MRLSRCCAININLNIDCRWHDETKTKLISISTGVWSIQSWLSSRCFCGYRLLGVSWDVWKKSIFPEISRTIWRIKCESSLTCWDVIYFLLLFPIDANPDASRKDENKWQAKGWISRNITFSKLKFSHYLMPAHQIERRHRRAAWQNFAIQLPALRPSTLFSLWLRKFMNLV